MPDVKVMVRMNGPLRVYGPISLVDAEEKEFTIPEGQWVSLCRCGKSDNKPFCDISHAKKEPAFDAPTTVA